ncbi:Conserved_hypothetical protein [Hexamita inflata]|uniref:Uncharacterized protein n=1 Tax=Hexamita inflata TaxID=28002 RepID=A0AA86QJY4_9EUKA|nr:Conserved hypothetical protein [Hexamita inflata]CAI9968267.1 Conserved hypothetical protein [Hexamita inflata]
METVPTPEANKGNKRLSTQQLLNLRALLDATKYIDQLLEQQPDQIVRLSLDQLAPLENALHISELLKMAEQQTAKKLPALKHVELTPFQQAINFVVAMFQKKQPDSSYSPSMFQNPLPDYLQNYYTTIKNPMCFLFIALRLKQTQIQGGIISGQIECNYNPLLNYSESVYGSMLEQRNIYYSTQAETISALQRHINEIQRKPAPYKTLGDVIADVLLIACDCCYYNSQNQQHYNYGKQFYQDCKEYLQKNKLFPTWANGILDQDFLMKLNMHTEKNEFDTVNLDELSEKTLRDLAFSMGIVDNSVGRDRIGPDQMEQGISFIKRRIGDF